MTHSIGPLAVKPISIGAALAARPIVHAFVLPGLRPKTVGALIGPGGSGKTTFALQIAAALAMGRPVAGGVFPAPDAPLRVAVLSAEDPEDVCIDRIRRIVGEELGFDGQLDLLEHSGLIDQLQERLHVYSFAGHDMHILRRNEPTPFLQQIISATTGFDLVILETVSRLHDGDENSATDMAALVTAAERLAQETGAAVILIHHSSKAADLNSRGDSQHASRGSSAFVDNIRWVGNLFTLGEDEAANRGLSKMRRSYVRFEITKANYVEPLPARLLRRHAGGLLKLDEVSEATGTKSRRATRGAK